MHLRLFVYNTLKSRKLVHKLLGHLVSESSTVLPGYIEIDGDYPTIHQAKNRDLKGEIFNLDPEDIKKLDDWEDHYFRIRVRTNAGPAWAYKAYDDV